MKIIIAPNSFKGSLDAFKVAQAIDSGLQNSQLDVKTELFPIADGGDHTLEVFHNWLGGNLKTSTVQGPLGKEINADWLFIDTSKTAVIEMAKASGISLLNEEDLNPLKANCYGTGQLIKKAIDAGAKEIILGLGGSATIDGGLGILQAVGAELFDSENNIMGTSSNPIVKMCDFSLEKIDPRIYDLKFIILCDVDNPLLGKNGAVHVFGPQKGADQDAIELLEKSMIQFHALIKTKTQRDFSKLAGGGAAGGIAIILSAFFNTSIVNGADFLLEKMAFSESLQTADILITAEGKVDHQTLHGKGPYSVAAKAKELGTPSIILAGKADDIDLLNDGFNAVFPITNGPMTLETAMNRTSEDLEATAKQIGNLLAVQMGFGNMIKS